MKRKRETTIKDLPSEIIYLISKYGSRYFDSKKDIGPLEANHIDIRRDEQGPVTFKSYMHADKVKTLERLEQLRREKVMVEAIYGERRAKEVQRRKDKLLDEYNDNLRRVMDL